MWLFFSFICLALGSGSYGYIEDKITLSKMENLHKEMTTEELMHYFEVNHHSKVRPSDYNVVKIRNHPVVGKRSGGPLDHDAAISMDAFGKEYQLRLRRNSHLVSDYIEHVSIDHNGDSHKLELNDTLRSCHYKILDANLVGGISTCSSVYRGFILDDKDILDLAPLGNRIHREALGVDPSGELRYHLVRKAAVFSLEEDFESEPIDDEILVPVEDRPQVPKSSEERQFSPRLEFGKVAGQINKRGDTAGKRKLKLEVGLFVDKKACDALKVVFDSEEFQSMDIRTEVILAMINSIQALYHHNELTTVIDITLVRIEWHDAETPFDTHDGEREPLLTSFCAYQRAQQPGPDSVPSHWDIALFLSGIDFKSTSKNTGKVSFSTMGLATVTGVCSKNDKHNCVIGEVAVRADNDGKTYPSTGFTTVFVMAHEIGHNLGLFHDRSSYDENFFKCERNGFIMSPTRSLFGEVIWSPCSIEYIQALALDCLMDDPAAMQAAIDHNKFHDAAGRIFTPAQQCKFYFPRDKNIKLGYTDLDDWPKMCYDSLFCESDERKEFVGPALPGTPCKKEKDWYCIDGSCQIHQFGVNTNAAPEWTPWQPTSLCINNCVENSKGYKESRRRCMNNRPARSAQTCPGPSLEITVCDDFDRHDPTCPSPPYSIQEYADIKCSQWTGFSAIANSYEDMGRKGQYDKDKPNQACLIECKLQGSDGYRSPVQELAGSGEAPYFPDGIVCHTNDRGNFYCVGGQCLLDGRSGRSGTKEDSPLTSSLAQEDEEEEDPEILPTDK